MEKLALLIQAVLCLCCCGSNASPTLIPPDVLEEIEAETQEFGYLLTMPQTLQAGAEEQYCLTLHGITRDTTVTMELLNEEQGIEVTYTNTYINGESECNMFQVPNVPGRYEVNLQNETATFASSEVQVLGNNLITFVQTDKPMYKPGQKVKFRILTMLRNLRSRVGQIESVFIKDPNDFKVKKYSNVETKGMASLEFQLINEAKLGTWTIEVTVDGEMTSQTFKVEEYVLPRFEVTIDPPAYFLVSSETFDGRVCAKYTYGKPVQGFLKLQVCPSGYGTFGAPCALLQTEINGCEQFSFNSSELLTSGRYFYGRSFNIDATVTEMGTGVQVNGTAPGPRVSYDPLKIEFLDDTNGYFKPSLPVHGRVKVSKPDGSPAGNESVRVSATDHSNNIYLDKVFVTDPQGDIYYSICHGLQENTSSISMFAEAINYEESTDAPYGRRMYRPTSHSNFRQWFSPSFSYIQIPAIHRPLKCGDDFNLNVPFTHNGLKPYIKFYYQVMSRGRIVHSGTTEAPTLPDPLSFLEPGVDNCLEVKERPTPPPRPTVPPIPDGDNNTDSGEIAPEEPPEPPMIDEPPMTIERSSRLMKSRETEPPEPPMLEPPRMPLISPVQIEPLTERVGQDDSDLRWKRSIMPDYGPGEEEEIVRSEHISDQLSNVELNIRITAEMSPSFSVLLFYIRDDGETVADSMEFKVEPCFDNKVQMKFVDETVLPGADTTIELKAASGSVCGIGVVDKSINILGGDHQITPTKVFDRLADYSLSARGQYRYSYFRSDYDYCKDRLSKLEKDDDEEIDGEEGPGNPPWSYMRGSYSSNYVDAIEAFKQMGMLVLTNLDVETRPCSWNHPIYLDGLPMLGSVPGIPGAPGPVPVVARLGSSGEEKNPRTNFPETWLWDLHEVGARGEVDLQLTVPHTITKWVGNTMCISDQAGFGLSPITSITAFQPFFLAFNLPYNAVREERLPITITVYNYLDKCLNMLLMVNGKKGFKIHGARFNRQPFCLCGGKSETKKIYITPQDIGKLPIFARAEIVPGNCGNAVEMDTQYIGLSDSVERQVLVRAEGVTQRYSHSLYVCPKGGERYVENFTLPLPKDMVRDSARGDVTVIGDIMGPALDNLDNLVRMPTGCGEQNMVGFTPNIYVLKYLTATGRLTEIMEDKAKNFMEIGYQRELKYRHSDGSFSAFGPSGDKPGSTWLTAFVVKSFAQALPYIFIDEKDLELSMNYLKLMQNPEEGPISGCFFERGEVFSSYMQGGLGKTPNDAALSAYVLIALLTGGLSTEDQVAVNGISCINRQLQSNPELDVYTLSLIAYVNVLYDPNSATTANIMQRLNRRATVEGDLKYWKREGELPKPVNSWYYYAAPSAEVEMTSYALMASLLFYNNDAVARTQPSVFWLSKQRNAFGGYASTQDTVLGLNALSEFAAKTYSSERTDLRLRVDYESSRSSFQVSDDNSLELQREVFDVKGNGTMRVSATGSGCALIQANIHYNKMPSKLGIDDPKFTLRVDPRHYQHDRNPCDKRTIYVTFGQRNSGQFSTGMIMLTVRMVSGWSVIPGSLKALRSRYPMLGIQREEVKEDEGVINFYLDALDTRTRRLALDVQQDRDLLISSPKPAEVQIYQYYEKDVTVIKSYNLRTRCGTKDELPYDQPESTGPDDFMLQRRLPIEGPIPRREEGGNLNVGASRGGQGAPAARGCPVCNLQKAPRNYNEIVCNSTAVYKAHAGRNKKYSLKIKANLRPRRKQRDNLFANIFMAEGCRCALLDPPMKTVIIVTQASNLVNKNFTVDSNTYVFNLRKDRTLEKKARRAQRKCRMN